MKIITIGREFSSGGREVGKRLADELGIAYYDKEIVAEIAAQSQLDEGYVEHILENGTPHEMFLTFGHTLSYASAFNAHPAASVLPIQKQVIRQLATKDCIIVGRCADVILADLNPFRLFVYADEESKLKRCRARQTEEESLMSDKKLIKKMRRIDKGRRKMHDLFLGKPWGNREGYDLCVNTSGVEVKEVVPCIAEYINRWYKDKE